jgi:glutaredoxin 3
VVISMQVTVYATTTCPYCKMLKDYLGQRSVTYVEKLVDTDEVAQKEMAKISNGFMGVPFVVVDKEGNKETIVGFDKGRLNYILGIN